MSTEQFNYSYKITLTTDDVAIVDAIRSMNVDSFKCITTKIKIRHPKPTTLSITEDSESFVIKLIHDNIDEFRLGFRCSAVKDLIPNGLHLKQVNMSLGDRCRRVNRRVDNGNYRCWRLNTDYVDEYAEAEQ